MSFAEGLTCPLEIKTVRQEEVVRPRHRSRSPKLPAWHGLLLDSGAIDACGDKQRQVYENQTSVPMPLTKEVSTVSTAGSSTKVIGFAAARFLMMDGGAFVEADLRVLDT